MANEMEQKLAQERKALREVRGSRATRVSLLGLLVVAGATVVVWQTWGSAIAAQIAYSGVSLLVVILVLLFGVSSWSRFVPQYETAPAGKKADRADQNAAAQPHPMGGQ